MRTLELQKLEELIAVKQQGIGKGDARILKNAEPDVLAFKALEALDRAVHRSLKSDDGEAFVSFTSLSCNIGRSVIQKVEKQEDTIQRKNTRRFRCGVWLLDRLADFKVIELVEDRNNRDARMIKIADWELFTKLILSIPVNLEKDPVDTRPSLTPLEPFKSFRHTSGAELVRKCSKTAVNAFKMDAMPQVYSAINRQMTQKWNINTNLLEIYNHIPVDKLANLAGKNLDKVQKESIIYSADKVLHLAKELGDRDFYTYCFYDFRGRLYQSTYYLNYGGSKLAKSLFYLDAKPLGEDGDKWIKIHIANSFGMDKETIENRVTFVTDHIYDFFQVIENIKIGWNMEDQLEFLSSIDDPYSFLAGVLELKRFYACADKRSFVSGLPIALDMTNSGAQIMSLLSRDEETGALCNLLDDTTRGDIYLFIADNVEAFKSDPYWHKHKDKRRSICKRSVMTYNYSCQARTMGQHLWDDFKSENGFEALTKKKCFELGAEIYESCRELMPKCTAMMDRFIELGLEAYRNKQHLKITLPTGFVMEQNYWSDETKAIWTKFQGKEFQSRVIIKKDNKIKYSKVKTATSPNVVHSFDAALLSFISTTGDYDKALVHDSFAACPADAGKLFDDTRLVAIDLFTPDQLLNCLNINDVEYGKLNIKGLAKNQYFCS